MDNLDDVDGCIHSIHVKNFFCHDNLEINLNRNVNFIVGRNGSGKSAILTALVVGLGGRASATNRGNNLHSFIKKGANSATIEIKIKNSSPLAYKKDVYGDYITIVRNITSSGGSSYKVKSASGEVKSTKFEEVQSIILAHDIQVDNPISVLNQDDARSFLASDPKKKFMLFRRATNLGKTEENYNAALENCRKATKVLERKTEACAELEKEYRKWKASYEELQSRDEMEAKKQALQNEYYWSEVLELEQDAKSDHAQCERQRQRVQKLLDKLKNMEQNFGCNTDTIEKLRTELEEKTSEKSHLEQELRKLEAEVREAQSALRSAQTGSVKQRDQLAREKRKVTDLEQAIENIGSGNAASRRAELERQNARAQEALEAAGARYRTAQHDAQQARANAAHAQQQADAAAGKAARHRDHIKQLKQQYRELESRGGDSLAVYGANMVELVRRVEQAAKRGQFSQPPRGPVGKYLKVKEKKWGGALEHLLGGSILSFCVNTPEDSRKLFEIMGQVYGRAAKPSVTCSKFLSSAHNVRGHSARVRGYSSALDALSVQEPVIINYLIDNLSFERVLLVPTHEEAVRLSDTEQNVPENCAKIVTLDSSEYYPAPNYRSYGGSARPTRYLHLSITERKKQMEAEIKEAESTLESLETEAEALSAAANEARDMQRDASKRLQAMMSAQHEAEAAARSAAAALDTHQAPHHDVLVEELNVSKEKMQTLESALQEYNTKEQEFRERIDKAEGRAAKLKGKVSQAATACRNLSDEIEQEQLKVDQGAMERLSCQQKLKEDKQRLAQIEKVLEEKQANIKSKEQAANMLCPRVDSARPLVVVRAELEKTQSKLRKLRSDGLSKAQVSEKLLEVERKYRRTRDTLNRLTQLVHEIKNTVVKHLKYCHVVQNNIASEVQISFQSILTMRGYSGSMDIDSAHSTLELRCTGRETAAKRHAATTSSLSGGERSYSTVAFIMALWECVELPFYFMDEFDVFMDTLNRKIVMVMLIDHALKKSNRQFVFLTPQDTSSVTASEQISIHRMADPRP